MKHILFTYDGQKAVDPLTRNAPKATPAHRAPC
jgi:hypothetical protein